MTTNKNLKIAVLPGDGIGMDVTLASLPVLQALNIPVQLTMGDIGWTFWQKEGNPIPDRTWELIAASDTVLLGATTSKPNREAQLELSKSLQKKNLHYQSPIIQLRQKLDLFANIRPCFSLHQENDFNFCIIRENTEGLYAGFDYYPAPAPIMDLLSSNPNWQHQRNDEISCTLRLQSKTGLQRLFEFAFQYAQSHQKTRVTFADKPNVLRQSSELSRGIFEEIAACYPHIKADILNVDAVALWLVRRPQEFGVIVAENMFGDILSDVAAGVMGGLGCAPSANIGTIGSYFEPVHGSAPRIIKDRANPSAMLLSISMLLEHFGYAKEAALIVQSLIRIISEGRFVTYDLGGNANTNDMAKAVIERCSNLAKNPSS